MTSISAIYPNRIFNYSEIIPRLRSSPLFQKILGAPYEIYGRPLNRVIKKEDFSKLDQRVLQIAAYLFGAKVEAIEEKDKIGVCFAQSILFGMHVEEKGNGSLHELFDSFHVQKDAVLQAACFFDFSSRILYTGISEKMLRILSFISYYHPEFQRAVQFSCKPIFFKNAAKKIEILLRSHPGRHLLLSLHCPDYSRYHAIYMCNKKGFLFFDPNIGIRKCSDSTVFAKNVKRELTQEYGLVYFTDLYLMEVREKLRSRL